MSMGVFMVNVKEVYAALQYGEAVHFEELQVSLEHYSAELASIDMEIARLAQLCGIQMLQPGVAEAVLRNDSSLCNSTNPVAWEKLRGLLVLHYHVVAENAAADGVDAAAETLRQALLSVSERMRPQQQ